MIVRWHNHTIKLLIIKNILCRTSHYVHCCTHTHTHNLQAAQIITCFNDTLRLSGTDVVGGLSIGFIHGITLVKMCYVIYINWCFGITIKAQREEKCRDIFFPCNFWEHLYECTHLLESEMLKIMDWKVRIWGYLFIDICMKSQTVPPSEGDSNLLSLKARWEVISLGRFPFCVRAQRRWSVSYCLSSTNVLFVFTWIADYCLCGSFLRPGPQGGRDRRGSFLFIWAPRGVVWCFH